MELLTGLEPVTSSLPTKISLITLLTKHEQYDILIYTILGGKTWSQKQENLTKNKYWTW